MKRLRAQEPRRLPTYAREIELTEALDDIFRTIRRIAKSQLMAASGRDRRPGA
jgi:phosphate:Na+ symporter